MEAKFRRFCTKHVHWTDRVSTGMSVSHSLNHASVETSTFRVLQEPSAAFVCQDEEESLCGSEADRLCQRGSTIPLALQFVMCPKALRGAGGKIMIPFSVLSDANMIRFGVEYNFPAL